MGVASFFFFSSRRRHTRSDRDWSSDVCSSDLFGAVVAKLDEAMFDLNKKVTAQMLRDREIAIHGSTQYVIDKIMKMRTECGYDDFCFLGWFELGGFAAKEIEEQMQIFAEEVMPVIARECGGKVELPARGLDLVT